LARSFAYKTCLNGFPVPYNSISFFPSKLALYILS
jgi:hypothetical protein